jgi:hypothetical protein
MQVVGKLALYGGECGSWTHICEVDGQQFEASNNLLEGGDAGVMREMDHGRKFFHSEDPKRGRRFAQL